MSELRDIVTTLIFGATVVGCFAVAGWTASKGQWGIALLMLLVVGSLKMSAG